MSANVTPVPGNPWFGVSMVLIGLVVGYIGATSMSDNPSMEPTPAAKDPAPAAAAPTPAAPSAKVFAGISDDDYIRGDKDATITVFEYSDFECPFCTRHHPTVQQVIDDIDDVNWVYRHYPLSFHPNAQKSAEAAECAGDQDKFWEMTDMIFDKGASIAKLDGYAAELSLDADDFTDCLDSDKYAQKVKDQMAAGSAAGVSGTPGNIVYNNKTKESRLISGAQPFSAFETAINELR